MLEKRPERVPCLKPGCTGTLNPILVNSYNGYCIKCITAVEKAAKEEYIRQNRKDINPYDGISDPVELLLIMYQYRNFRDPLVNLALCPSSEHSLIAEMTVSQLERLEKKLSSMLSSRNEELKESARRIILLMVSLTEYELDRLLLKLVKDIDDCDSSIFRRGGEKVQDALFKLLAKGEEAALACLVWNNSATVFQRLIHLRKEPPAHLPDFSQLLDYFAADAGWEVTAASKRRELFYQSSREMVLLEKPSESASLFKSHLDAHERCPWCKGPLGYLANVDAVFLKSMLGIDILNSYLPFYYCARCIFGVQWLFCELLPDGLPKWSAANKFIYGAHEDASLLTFEELPDRELSFAVSSQLRDPYLFSGELEFDGFKPYSQFGGAPCWLQNAEYPECPRCKMRMTFLFQIDADGHQIFDLGMYYAFFCEKCQSYTATMRQCT